MRNSHSRRDFLRELGISTAAIPFLGGLQSLWADENSSAELAPKKRLIVFFSPNGTLPDQFWPDSFDPDQPLKLKSMLEPLAPFTEQMLMLKGVHNKVRGDGDGPVSYTHLTLPTKRIV